MQLRSFVFLCAFALGSGLKCTKFASYEKSACANVLGLRVPDDFAGLLNVNVSVFGSQFKEIEPTTLTKKVPEIKNRQLRYSLELPECASARIRVTGMVLNGLIICQENAPFGKEDVLTKAFAHEISARKPGDLKRRSKRQNGDFGYARSEPFPRVLNRYPPPYTPREPSDPLGKKYFRELVLNGQSSSLNGYEQNEPITNGFRQNDPITNGFRQNEPTNTGFRQNGPINTGFRQTESFNNGFRQNEPNGFGQNAPTTNGFRQTGFGDSGLRDNNNGFRATTENPTPSSTNENDPECGTIINSHLNLINGGQLAVKGDFPWTVALFLKTGPGQNGTYICTGNQITNKHVITAGHCTNVAKHRMFVVPGIIHLEDVEVNTIYEIDAIHKHPKYEGKLPNHDVAIITVINRMPGMPVCLWPRDLPTSQFVGSKGVVLGWGRYNKDVAEASAWLKMIQVPIVSQETCIFSNDKFRNLVVENTFCGGDRDLTGPCSGDSGGGFNYKIGGKFYLRGVVSSAIAINKTCDLSNYVIFTDVAKHLSWVNRILTL